MPGKERPLGVSILAIISFLIGLSLFLFGLVDIGYGGLTILIPFPSPIRTLMGGGMLIMGFILTVFGLIWISMSIGLWKGKNWARILSMVIGFIQLLSGLTSMILFPLHLVALFNILIGLILLYYFTREYVKRFFTS